MILRDLQPEKTSAETLLVAAILVQRAGLVHLVADPTKAEVLALAEAADIVVAARAAILLDTVGDGVRRVCDEARISAALKAGIATVNRG